MLIKKKKDNLKKLDNESISNLISSLKGEKGENGKTPTEKELIEIIKPLIPKVKDGYTPIKGIDYVDGKNGKTPTEKELIDLIIPLIPEPIKGEKGDSGLDGLNGSPDTAEDIIKKINNADIKSVIDIKKIKGIKEIFQKELDSRIPVDMIGSPRIKMYNNDQEMSSPLGSLNIKGSGYSLTNKGQDYLLDLSGAVDTDEKVKVSANDTTAGYLNGKIVAGANITITEQNDGGNETLEISTTAQPPVWGNITGTLSDQTDLQNELDNKYDVSNPAGYISSVTGQLHNNLSGLTTGDPHTQYAFLTGRAGGQTIIGGTGVTDKITYRGTSGNGTLTSEAHTWQVGNNGSHKNMWMLNNGEIHINQYTTFPAESLKISIGGNSGVKMTHTGGFASSSIDFRRNNNRILLADCEITNPTFSGNQYLGNPWLGGVAPSSNDVSWVISRSGIGANQTIYARTQRFAVNNDAPRLEISANGIDMGRRDGSSSGEGIDSINLSIGKLAGKISIGSFGTTTPTEATARLEITDTTEQLRVRYDVSNYYSTTVSSSGLVTLNATGASAGFAFSNNIRLTQTVTAETLVSDTSVTMVINGTTYKLLAKA